MRCRIGQEIDCESAVGRCLKLVHPSETLPHRSVYWRRVTAQASASNAARESFAPQADRTILLVDLGIRLECDVSCAVVMKSVHALLVSAEMTKNG